MSENAFKLNVRVQGVEGEVGFEWKKIFYKQNKFIDFNFILFQNKLNFFQ